MGWSNPTSEILSMSYLIEDKSYISEVKYLPLEYEKVFKAFPFYHSNHFVSYRSFRC